MPLECGVQDRVAEPQWVHLAPVQELRFALEAHHMGSEPFARPRASQLDAEATAAPEQTKRGRAFFAAGRRHGGIPVTLGQTPSQLESQTRIHLNLTTQKVHSASIEYPKKGPSCDADKPPRTPMQRR